MDSDRKILQMCSSLQFSLQSQKNALPYEQSLWVFTSSSENLRLNLYWHKIIIIPLKCSAYFMRGGGFIMENLGLRFRWAPRFARRPLKSPSNIPKK